VPKSLNKAYIYEEYPLLFHKHQNNITLFNIAGEIKYLDLEESSKSWINSNFSPAFCYSFGARGLAACSNTTKSTLGSVVVVAVQNNQVPYVFVNSDS